MKKYYEVIAKCGHVGRNRYFEGHFFVKAESVSEASQRVKVMPRVKRNHKDAILYVFKITREEFFAGAIEKNNNPYYNCNTKSVQNECWEQIKDFVYPETERQMLHRERNLRKEARGSKGKIRNQYKYNKLNSIPTYDWEDELMGA